MVRSSGCWELQAADNSAGSSIWLWARPHCTVSTCAVQHVDLFCAVSSHSRTEGMQVTGQPVVESAQAQREAGQSGPHTAVPGDANPVDARAPHASTTVTANRITDFKPGVFESFSSAGDGTCSAAAGLQRDGLGRWACAVCMERHTTHLVCLPCGHVFHLWCSACALRDQRACPVCRAAVGGRGDVRRVYL